MTPVLEHIDESLEAVIISGPRKGEFITIAQNHETASLDIESLMDSMLEIIHALEASIAELKQDNAEFHQEMQERRQKRDELLREISRSNKIPA